MITPNVSKAVLSSGFGSFIVLVVAEDISQAGGARHLQSFGIRQNIEGQVQVIGTHNSNCLYWLKVLKTPIFLALKLANMV